MLTDVLKQYDDFVIYGAQVIAHGAYVAIRHLTGRLPVCFAVGEPQGIAKFPSGNPSEIDGVKVRPIGAYTDSCGVRHDAIDKNTFVLVGVTELVQKEVLPYLKDHGYENVFALTQHEEHLLMSAYYAGIGMFLPAGCTSAERRYDFAMYEVRNDRDKVLENHPSLFSYEHPIQAGAALTDLRIADLTDHTGRNISDRNRMYCEMTAAYWVWQNTGHEWVGIEHYRRHLLVRPEMLSDEVDAILPLPYICYPHEMAQFLRFTTEDVLDAMQKALKDLHPDEYESYRAILYGRYQYTYDLVCAKRQVFNDYCRWFFEITEYMETMADRVPEIRETRALSYVAEVLTNLYFMSHQKDLKIRHAEKEIYV